MYKNKKETNNRCQFKEENQDDANGELNEDDIQICNENEEDIHNDDNNRISIEQNLYTTYI